MTDEVENHSRTLKVVQQDYHELRDRVNELEVLNDNLTMERDELAHQIDGMEDTISDLSGMVTAHQVALEKFGALFEEMGGSGDVASTLRSKKAQKALKGPRDNVLNVRTHRILRIHPFIICRRVFAKSSIVRWGIRRMLSRKNSPR